MGEQNVEKIENFECLGDKSLPHIRREI